MATYHGPGWLKMVLRTLVSVMLQTCEMHEIRVSRFNAETRGLSPTDLCLYYNQQLFKCSIQQKRIGVVYRQ
jgi:hypothetical protein